MSTFVDSSVWFAAACKRDRNNELAKSILLSIDRCTLTNHVLAQTWQMLNAQFGTGVADTFWERLREIDAVVEPVTATDLETARQMSEAYPHEELSLVDRTSFAVMQRCGITRAATFSSSFEIFRYGPRKKAFQIVRTGHSATFLAMKDAILRRKTLRLNYNGRDLTACPYILGHALQEERAFVLAVDGIGRPTRAERGKWMCLRLASVDDIKVLDQPWTEQPYPGRIQRCVDSVHLDAARLGTAKSTAVATRVSSKKTHRF
ncbi:PIN domain-containing protein [Bradyrhizobium diazoefficiens]|uniref:type II toxin-antitoxin system VapC family toxin n=1 Tax=Bradyrhizobium diazoefficiens TaxID=1355477 RepID=UPI00190A30F6|nr:PIN domain-containing protein [Bradyrhizobium diazoefficiens]QQO16768.1 PIN domain-containing protein [Bradyrhizobium diazoefficiens]